MPDRITFEKEVECLGDFCRLSFYKMTRDMGETFVDPKCVPKDAAAYKDLYKPPFELPRTIVMVCSGRPTAQRQEMIRSVMFFGEFANKMLMTAITSIARGALKLIGAK